MKPHTGDRRASATQHATPHRRPHVPTTVCATPYHCSLSFAIFIFFCFLSPNHHHRRCILSLPLTRRCFLFDFFTYMHDFFPDLRDFGLSNTSSVFFGLF